MHTVERRAAVRPARRRVATCEWSIINQHCSRRNNGKSSGGGGGPSRTSAQQTLPPLEPPPAELGADIPAEFDALNNREFCFGEACPDGQGHPADGKAQAFQDNCLKLFDTDAGGVKDLQDARPAFIRWCEKRVPAGEKGECER